MAMNSLFFESNETKPAENTTIPSRASVLVSWALDRQHTAVNMQPLIMEADWSSCTYILPLLEGEEKQESHHQTEETHGL